MNRKIIGAAFALATLASASAFADAQGYVTVGVGATKVDIDCTGTSSCDDTGTAAKVVGGWEFTKDFAAEVSYNYLGQMKATFTNDPTIGTGDVAIKASYVGLGVAWRPTFGNNFGGLVRAGAAFVNTKVDVTSSALGPGNESHSSTHPYFGLGLTYAFDKNFGVELTWDRVDVSVDDGSGGDSSSTTDTFALGATYHF